MVTYFKNQKDIAKALNNLIDQYWNYEMDESLVFVKIKELVLKNDDKVFIQGNYSSVIRQRLGKRRIELLNKILKQEGDK